MQEGASFYDMGIDFMIKNQFLEVNSGGGFKINFEQLTPRGKEIGPMLRDSTINSDSFYIKEQMNDVSFILEVSNLLNYKKGDEKASIYILVE